MAKDPKEKRRKRWPFDDEDDLFDSDFDSILDDMRRRMERMMEFAARSADAEGVETGRPYVYGYSFRVGPDGKPEFQEFGDTRMLKPGTTPSEAGGREPLTDIIERGDTLSITVELPGVEREDIDMRVTENRVTVKVDKPERQYYKEVELPGQVDPNSVKATFKNGVLDITLKRIGGPTGRKVRID